MTTPDNVNNSAVPQRNAQGHFLPGHGGRKPGARNKISRETLSALQDLRGITLTKLRALIEAGNERAIIWTLDKILPSKRTVELDDTRPATIAEMLASGEISPDEGRDIAATVKALREVEDIEALRAKLIELEAIVTDGANR